jgi:hypothetical protein
MKRLLLFILLFPSVAFAVTDKVIHVNMGCGNNGNGTATNCASSGGGAGAYNSLASAISTEATNLVTADKRYVFTLEGSSSETISTTISFSGYTTDSTRYIYIHPGSGSEFGGVWNTSKPRIVCTDYDGCYKPVVSKVTVEGTQAKSTRTTDGPGSIIFIDDAGNASGTFTITGNLFAYECSSGCTNSDQNAGIMIKDDGDVDSVHVIAANNIIYGFQEAGIKADTTSGDSWSLVFDNNSLVHNGVHQLEVYAYGTNDTIFLKNNLLNGTGSDTDFYIESAATSYTHSNNISEDTSSPDSSFRSKAVTFENEGGNDFHLGSSDTNAKDAGTDLSADGTYAFSTDIDLNARSGSWDIGADELVGGGGGGGGGTIFRQNPMNGGMQ